MEYQPLLNVLVLLALGVLLDPVASIMWPVPYKRFQSRPKADPYCKALYPFCPTGNPEGGMPKMQSDDVIEVFAMKAPVWEFKFGNLLAKFDIIHDAIGFRNNRTGQNYTMEWYELFQLGNSTFPHITSETPTPVWCNQGAACIYDTIDDQHWAANGTLVKVAEMTGDQFNKFGVWAKGDNDTGIYYETWTVEDSPGGKMWFDSYDCASFVVRAFNVMGLMGAKFNQSVHLNYTRIHLYCDEPQYLGNASTIFGPISVNNSLATDIRAFYSNFQPHQPIVSAIQSVIQALETVFSENKFYFFYNYEYWFLPMKAPHIKLTYTEAKLPGPK
ncbi:unnamed protein product [Owenia fusiformis]|uniref:Bis(monoacylglycero)phosphate synthase CLN5 n=1 Tax=Owenia fusiformis TaxID=6347 RepID=A0A8J1TIR8_OWEFU|nr:unnamed protein product [Owenia fusiformis]